MPLTDIWTLFGQIDTATHNFTPTSWSVNHHPGANTKATITKAAVTGKRHIATTLTVTLAAGAAAPTATVVSVSVIDGASGGATYLWGPHDVSIPAVAGALNGIALPVWLPATLSTAITIEFSAAAGANTLEAVTLCGITVA